MSKAAREVEIYAFLAQPLTARVATNEPTNSCGRGPGVHGAETGSLTFGIAPGGLFRLSALWAQVVAGLAGPVLAARAPRLAPAGDLRWKLPGQRRAYG